MIKTKTIDGLKIAYRINDGEWIDGRKTLLFIHGTGGDHTHWENQYEKLDKDFNTIAVDLPGHGLSEGRGEREIIRYVDWVRKMMETLGMNAPVLIGYSLGAAIGLTFAVYHSAMISGVIPVAGGAKMKVNPLFLEGLKNDKASVIPLIVKLSLAKANRERLTDFLTRGFSAADAEVMHGDFSSVDRLDLTEELSRITAPTLLICGDEDKMTPPDLSIFMRDCIPGAQLALIPEAGHCVMVENVEAFNQAVIEFISSLPDTPHG